MSGTLDMDGAMGGGAAGGAPPLMQGSLKPRLANPSGCAAIALPWQSCRLSAGCGSRDDRCRRTVEIFVDRIGLKDAEVYIDPFIDGTQHPTHLTSASSQPGYCWADCLPCERG